MTKQEIDLMEEELKNEAAYKVEGYQVLLSRLHNSAETQTVDVQNPMGKAFFNYKVLAVKDAITSWLKKNIKPKAGVKPTYVFLLDELKEVYMKEGEVDIDAISNIFATYTLSSIINAICSIEEKTQYLNNVGEKVGKGIIYEFQLKAFENWLDNLPDDHKDKYALRGLDKRVGAHYRSFYLKNAMKKCKYKVPTWEKQAEGLRTLGVSLVVLAEEATGYFTLENAHGVPTHLVPTLQFSEAWQRNENNMLDRARRYCPMVVPPAPWTTIDDGGYYGELSTLTSLLRLKYMDTSFGESYKKRLSQLAMPDVYKAVNAIQDTPYTINKKVVAVLKDCRAQGYLPCASESSNVIGLFGLELPARPAKDATDEEVARYKKEAIRYYKNEKRRMSLQNKANDTLNTAIKFAKYERIYFPWNMDFRGRIYPIPLFSPQGDDLTKGLLLFADTPPFENADGWKWLAITGANLAGVDKVSYDDRIQWVKDHEEVILAVAADPMGCQWWLQQEEPVQMLAFCFEWAKAVAWIAEHGSIVGFTTGLPYAQDGTCSGLQHFSAILRDPIGGEAVNLVPQDKPNDIYAQVAEKVKIFLKKDSMNGSLDEWNEEKNKMQLGTKTMAQIWLNFGITRKVTKRPTMTLAYGAKKAGYVNQILDDTIKPAMREQEDSCVFNDQNAFQCAQYLAGLIWQGVSKTVVKAVEGMDWLHKCAKLVTKNSHVVSWVTPLGLLLQQSYTKYNIEIVKLRCAGKRFRIYTPHQTGEIDKVRQANGIAPNFIHSMDACHLQMTVCRAKDAGINHFAMIHDSYGCPMSQAELMFDIVRQSFVDMYTDFDVLEMFRECLQPLSNKPLPALPQKGSLDLNCVKDSKYIFC